MTDALDIAFIGHCTKDEITIKGATAALPGGGVYFGGLSAAWCHRHFSRAAPRFAVLTIGSPADFTRISAEFAAASLTLRLIEDSCTTTFLHAFRDDQPDQRVSSVGAVARPFAWADLAPIRARLLYVNPLFHGELDPALLALAKANCELLFLDAQGLIRRRRGRVIHHECPADLAAALAPVDIFKVDAEEAASLTGLREAEAACAAIMALGVEYLICTQQRGVAVFHGGQRFWADFAHWTLEGRTGRGDTVSAAFLVLHFLKGWGIAEAIAGAAKACSSKMMHPGAAVEKDFDGID
jgi:sugar/nucleoside kinase (ribokinase family)